MEVISATTASGDQLTGDNAQALDKLNGDFDSFLNLLTTQLQNQDPLDPMDSSEFTNQLVQFSAVEQQIQTNQSLDEMLTLQIASMNGLGLGYIGLDIEMPGNLVTWDGTNSMSTRYTLKEPAVQTVISVVDSEGNVVYTEDGETAAGEEFSFTWDGRGYDEVNDEYYDVDPGSYEIRVGAIDANEKAIGQEQFVSGRVTGIETSEFGQLFLVVGENKVAIGNVTRADLPPESTTTETTEDTSTETEDTES